jgi:signal transduction histidine kinase/ligand-binding sensor domain-containing protein/DNA-binding response OmpR family regulator
MVFEKLLCAGRISFGRVTIPSLVCCLYLFSCESLRGQDQQISFGRLTVENGLSQNSVISIAQDQVGALWFATQDGLNRYDGLNFEKFDEYFDDITKPNVIRLGKVLIDRDDQVWLITKTGKLKRYNPYNFQTLEIDAVRSASCIAQDQSGNIIVGTWLNGIYLIDPSNGAVQDHLVGHAYLEGDTINVVIQDQEKNYWFGTSAGVYVAADIRAGLKPPASAGREKIKSVNALAVARDGSLWIGTFQHGLFVKKKDEDLIRRYALYQPPNETSAFDDLHILSLLVDYKDRLWIGTYGNGLFMVDEGRTQHFTQQKNNPNSITYNDILCLFEDENHVIWCGTDGGGASLYDENLHKFSSFTDSNVPVDIHTDVIRSIIKDSRGVVWLGTSGYGLTLYDDKREKQWRSINSFNSDLTNDRIMCLAEDRNGKIWIGTQGGGLNIYNPVANRLQTFYEIQTEAYLPDHTVWTIFHDEQDRHWIGTRDQGLCLFDPEKGLLKQYTPDNSNIPGVSIRAIISQDDHTLWIGTENNGICKFDLRDEHFEIYQRYEEHPDSSLSSNLIKSLYLADDHLWIGTSGGGLNVMDLERKQVRVFTTEDGLPNNIIYAILPDENGNLWLSTNRGISKFTPPQFPVGKEGVAGVINYDNYDGLQGLEFNTGAYFRDQNGQMYFGGINGYSWFKPEDIVPSKQTSRAIISMIQVNGSAIRSDTITSRINVLRLKSNQNDISFSFSALNFSMPQRNTYRYRLMGYDEGWIESGVRNYVSYTNLLPGTYVFSVLGGNHNGIFHEHPASVTITIIAPWWRTTWAYMGAVMAIGLIAFWIYRFQHNRWMLKTQLQLEHHETERLKELDHFKTQFYTNITHEFRTPLTVILGLIEKCRQYFLSNDDSRFGNATNVIQRNANRLLSLVNQMLDLSKLESKSYDNRLVNGDIVAFLKNLVALYESHAVNNGLHLSFESPLQKLVMDYDPDTIQKIVSNLLTNAIKFTEKGYVETQLDELTVDGRRFAKIEVRDSGIGIQAEYLPHIFDRFYQVNDPDKKRLDGSGIGLALVKELLELIDGTIGIKSEPGFGTVVTVVIPIVNEATAISPSTEPPTLVEVKSEAILVEEESIADTDGNPLVLLIEDNPDVLFYLTSCLNENFQLVQAVNGDDGISKATEVVPDIIISDVMMPGKNGYEVCEILKEDRRTSHIPIILLTAKAAVGDRIQGLKYGADAYLVKPFDVEELLAQVDNLIKSREAFLQRLKDMHDGEGLAAQYSTKENEFITELNALIKEELASPALNVERVCDHLHMSRTQLHRKIKALTEKSTTAYIRYFRLLEARKLLQTTNYSIKEIAYKTGFSDYSYFHRSFMKEFNKKPTAFRES